MHIKGMMKHRRPPAGASPGFRVTVLLTLLIQMAPAQSQHEWSTVLIGDSILWGNGVTDTTETAPSRMSAAGLKIINISSPAAMLTLSNLSATMRYLDGFYHAIDSVIVQVGINDWNQGVSHLTFNNAYKKLLDDINATGAKLYCTLIPFSGSTLTERGGPGGSTLMEYILIAYYRCAAHGGTYINVVLGPEDYPADDPMHPNAAGHGKIASAFLQALGY